MKNCKFDALRALAAALMLMLCAPTIAADKPETPTTVSGFAIVTPEQARALVGKASFYDMRSAINYGKGHVQGAKALPYGEKSGFTPDFDGSKDKFDMSKLPADKSATIVFYSDGPKGWKSYKAAVLASKAGYTNVKWMHAGTTGWQAKGLPFAS
ncbi:MAG: rhodanese-like domain-containing protein [Betaproteobacteria bacterium]|nr:rhodanese-like domain-containing protein [Betaproteobacteria bacterium]MDH5221338.1 rhodanese-like domain-containing protein [Betaproteobacteria bacterium]MDH5352579.1 rhodanese-like domain-containing protein [Betaproteobacteria bacterium]